MKNVQKMAHFAFTIVNTNAAVRARWTHKWPVSNGAKRSQTVFVENKWRSLVLPSEKSDGWIHFPVSKSFCDGWIISIDEIWPQNFDEGKWARSRHAKFFFRDKYPTCDVSFHSFNRRTIIFFFHSTIPRIRSNDITYDVQLGRCSSNENSLKIAAIRNFVFCYFPIQLELCLFSSLDPFVATYFFLIFLSDANHFTSDCFEFLLKLISPDSKWQRSKNENKCLWSRNR